MEIRLNLTAMADRPFTLWLQNDRGEAAVFSGTLRQEGTEVYMDRGDKPRFAIREEWFERIKMVPNEETREILLGADYFLRLSVGTLPDEVAEEEMEQTGLKWPE